jgi:hypothetical protein
MSRGWAASRDGLEGSVRPVFVCKAPRLSPRKALEETAMRSTMALPAAALYELADRVGKNSQIASYALAGAGFVASGISEFRGPLVEEGRIGQQLRREVALHLPPQDDGMHAIIPVPIDSPQDEAANERGRLETMCRGRSCAKAR